MAEGKGSRVSVVDVDMEGWSDEDEDSETDGAPAKVQLPWEVFRPYFDVVSKDDKNFKVKCKLCLSSKAAISTSLHSSSNLKRHIKIVHASKLKELEKAQDSYKRKSGEGSQQTVDQSFANAQAKKSKPHPLPTVTQQDVDERVLEFVITGIRPFSDVEDPSFRACVLLGLPDTLRVMCRKTLMAKISALFERMKKNLTTCLGEVEYVTTTIDGWSKPKKAFIGVVVLYIDSRTLERKKAVLACQRIQGRHTFDVLANAIDDINKQFSIQNKIVMSTTDGGSNFCKSFRVFGQSSDTTAGASAQDGDSDEDPDEEERLELAPILDDGHSSSAKNDDFAEVVLPKHQRCASHSLARVGVHDASPSNVRSCTTERSAKGKCRALWTRQNKSTVAADGIKKVTGKYFVTPTETRWNAEFDSIEDLVKTGQREDGDGEGDGMPRSSTAEQPKKGEDVLNAAFDAAGLPRLTHTEFQYLKEYCSVMRPLARALDILQADENMYQGYLLPTVTSLEIALNELIEKSLTYCDALARAVLKGVQTRFEGAKNEDQNIVAACVLPEFKLSWLPPSQAGTLKKREEEDKALAKKCEKLVIAEMVRVRDERGQTSTTSATESPPLSSKTVEPADPFFRLRVVNVRMRTSQEICREEWKNFLHDERTTLNCLHDYPNVKRVFLKTNTPVPSSGSVERLFSLCGRVLAPLRGKIGDKTFEEQVMLKANKCFW